MPYPYPQPYFNIAKSGLSYDPAYKAVLDYASANSMTLPSAASQQIGNQLMIDSIIAGEGDLSGIKKLHFFATDIAFGTSAPSNLGFDGINYANVANNTATRKNTVTKHVNKGYASDGTTSGIDITFLASQLNDISKFGVILIGSDTVQGASASPRQISKVANNDGQITFFDRNTQVSERYLFTSAASDLFNTGTSIFNTIGIALEFSGGTGTTARAKLHNTAWTNFTNNYSNAVVNFTATLHNYLTVFCPSTYKVSAYAIYDKSIVDGSALLTAIYNAVAAARLLP